MSVPPVPPRPLRNEAPPVPPLPPDLRYSSPPHFDQPIAAPRPSNPRNMAHQLDQWTSPTPTLTAPLPTIPTLQSALTSIQIPSYDPSQKIHWARDVLFLVEKQSSSSSTDTPIGPAIIHDPALLRLAHTAVPLVLDIASTQPHIAEALYLRATFEASGAYPDYIQHNPRSAFRDFEAAARSGYPAAWFRLGRDYENFNDVVRAKDCFERGLKLGVESCAYRMGMAHLMGQLGLPINPTLALPLLHRAATLSTPQVPQPAYVYALLLLSEFTQLPAPLNPSLFAPFIPQNSSPLLEARKLLERAAYLGFPPAQYKLGHAYEFAQDPFPFDPLLSVQYYSLASQQGEVEADMALSKWFLCGSGDGPPGDGGFEKDEALAWTFADKAARRGLPSAEFAMGYYAEVGVGGQKDIAAAMRWYALAKEHGNKDAADRLAALSQDTPQTLSRLEHDAITENKLVRKRTMAKERSDKQQSPVEQYRTPQYAQQQQQQSSSQQRPPRRQVLENVRKSSLMVPGTYPTPGIPPRAISPAPGTYFTPGMPPRAISPAPGTYSTPPVPGGYPAPGTPQQQPNPYARPQSGQQLPRPLSQPQLQQPHAKRYTLTDGQMSAGQMSAGQMPSNPGMNSPAGRHSPAGMGRGRRKPSGGVPAASGEGEKEPTGEVGLGGGVVFSAKPSKGPTTFAEMGFQGAKAEDKECVIM